jgi:hypothetical protein
MPHPNRLTNVGAILASVLLTFLSAQGAVITVNGMNEIGTSDAVDSIGYRQSIALSNYSFEYTMADGDAYQISGEYAASFDGGGTSIYVEPTVVYKGAAPAVSSDSITFDLLQNYFDDSPGTWDGEYTETIPLGSNTAVVGSTMAVQLFIDGQGLPPMGPFGPGNDYSAQNTADLTGLDGDTLSYDYRFQVYFPRTTKFGAEMAIESAVTPEPALTVLCGIALLLSVLVVRRRGRSA